MNIEFFDISVNEGQNAELINKKSENGISEYTFKLTWTEKNAENNDKFIFCWSTPLIGMMYGWNPKCSMRRDILRSWDGAVNHMFSNGAPMGTYYDGHGKNKYTVALSEAKMLTSIQNGVNESNGDLQLKFSLGTQQYTKKYKTEIKVRIDERNIPMYEAIHSVTDWWVSLGMEPVFVPEAAKEPCYSFWYSYHQDINDKNVEEECKRAKELGFNVCIVDDGWQNAKNKYGYAYCGDWDPSPDKFPDMAAHVRNVHDIGMKYILWYGTPFLGYYSKSYDIFKDMTLRQRDNHNGKEFILDPRYKEVREHFTNKCVKALKEWNLDGFKLDFIDNWEDRPDNAPYNEKMDIPQLQDAVDVFMTNIITALKEIKPDILIEFRQNYIGPHMRKFGNMFRVSDCPCDYIENRMALLDLRMLMGNSAVHSDMLMWHKDESAEQNALQIIGIIFGVMQYSSKLDSLNDRTKKMSKFWLNLMKEKKDLLLNGELRSYDPQLTYTWAQSIKDDECFVAVYAEDKCIKPEMRKTTYIANGTTAGRVLCELVGNYIIEIFDCCGEKVGEKTVVNNEKEIISINVPIGGLAIFKN